MIKGIYFDATDGGGGGVDQTAVLQAGLSGLGTAAAGGFNPVADAIGIGELLSGIAKSKKATTLRPPSTDPLEEEFYGHLDNLRKGYTTGAAFNQAMKSLKDQTAITNNAITNRAGGYGGGAIAGLSQASGVEGDTFSKLMADAEGERLKIMQMEGNAGEAIATRRGASQEEQYAQALETGANQKQSGFTNLLSGTAGTKDFFPALLKLLSKNGASVSGDGTDASGAGAGIGTTDPNAGVGIGG